MEKDTNIRIGKIFDSIITNNNLFKDKGVLQTSYTPETIPHRDDQIEQIASILAPALRGERTSNLFVYGKTGTGKTLSVQCVRNELLKRNNFENNNLIIEYINCKMKKVSDTEYRIFAELIKKLGGNVPATGLPSQVVIEKFIELIDNEKKLIILIFDEIDHAVGKISGNFLYTLTRLNSELSKSQISIIGISNNLTFLDGLDTRVKSSLSEEEIVFPSYNALELQDILKERAELAFKIDILEEGVISKCAAFAAREHGDARRALDLLRIAGELAERNNADKITLKDIDEANEKIEKDKTIESVKTAPKQFQLTLLAIMQLVDKNQLKEIYTGDVYNTYQELCDKTKTDILTQRRVSDIITEFDMMGLINSSVISKGRQGRTREIKLFINPILSGKVKTILHESLNLNE
jgi:cell division control protein 6